MLSALATVVLNDADVVANILELLVVSHGLPSSSPSWRDALPGEVLGVREYNHIHAESQHAVTMEEWCNYPTPKGVELSVPIVLGLAASVCKLWQEAVRAKISSWRGRLQHKQTIDMLDGSWRDIRPELPLGRVRFNHVLRLPDGALCIGSFRRLLLLAPNGEGPVRVFGGERDGLPGGPLRSITGLAYDARTHSLCVADSLASDEELCKGRVLRLKLPDLLCEAAATRDEEGRSLCHVVGITVLDGVLYVGHTDVNGPGGGLAAVVTFAASSMLPLRTAHAGWHMEGLTACGQMLVAAVTRGLVFIDPMSGEHKRILGCEHHGVLVGTKGVGLPPLFFRGANGLTSHRGQLYVTERNGRRLQVVDPDGKRAVVYKLPEGCGLSGICADEGHVYVCQLGSSPRGHRAETVDALHILEMP